MDSFAEFVAVEELFDEDSFSAWMDYADEYAENLNEEV